MPRYVKITDNIPTIIRFNDLRKENPNVSFPVNPPDAILSTYDVYPVTETSRPSYDTDTQILAKGPIEEVDGVWTQTWTITDKTQSQLDTEMQTRKDNATESMDRPESFQKVLLKISFLQENKIRVLQGKSEITAEQFKNWVQGQL